METAGAATGSASW